MTDAVNGAVAPDAPTVTIAEANAVPVVVDSPTAPVATAEHHFEQAADAAQLAVDAGAALDEIDAKGDPSGMEVHAMMPDFRDDECGDIVIVLRGPVAHEDALRHMVEHNVRRQYRIDGK